MLCSWWLVLVAPVILSNFRLFMALSGRWCQVCLGVLPAVRMSLRSTIKAFHCRKLGHSAALLWFAVVDTDQLLWGDVIRTELFSGQGSWCDTCHWPTQKYSLRWKSSLESYYNISTILQNMSLSDIVHCWFTALKKSLLLEKADISW